MKTLVFVLVLLVSGCVHLDKTSSSPIRGVLLDKDGIGISGAQIWAYFQLPGGIFAAPKHKAFGPALTEPNGEFTLPLEVVSMIQTGTIFDGSGCQNECKKN
jgi:hypothetical protein